MVRTLSAYKSQRWYAGISVSSLAFAINVIIRSRPDLIVWSDDLSGFDRHVKLADQLGVMRVYEHLGWDKIELKLYEELLTLGTLGGPVDGGKAMAYYARCQETNSGQITTSVDGTTINTACVIECYAEATGRTPREARIAWQQGLWYFFILGDDTLLFAEPGLFDSEKYKIARAVRGYECKLGLGASLLMKVFTRDYYSGLIARFFAQTFLRERPSKHRILAWIGLVDRFDGIKAHPYAARAWEIVLELNSRLHFLPQGVDTPAKLRRYVALPEQVAAFQALFPPNSVPLARLLQELTRGVGSAEGVWASMLELSGLPTSALKLELTGFEHGSGRLFKEMIDNYKTRKRWHGAGSAERRV